MFSAFRSVSAFLLTLLLALPSFAFEFPLSETASRSAYFLGQRKDAAMSDFLSRYSKHLPAPKSGPYVSDIMFQTPYAQLVWYSSRQGVYTAQQAEIDGRTKFSTIEVTVYIYFTDTYGALIVEDPSSRYSTPGLRARRSDFWRDFKFVVFDGDNLREPTDFYGDPQYRCTDGGCSLVGSEIHLSIPAEDFNSDSAAVEVVTPDEQTVRAEFNLATLR